VKKLTSGQGMTHGRSRALLALEGKRTLGKKPEIIPLSSGSKVVTESKLEGGSSRADQGKTTAGGEKGNEITKRTELLALQRERGNARIFWRSKTLERKGR